MDQNGYVFTFVLFISSLYLSAASFNIMMQRHCIQGWFAYNQTLVRKKTSTQVVADCLKRRLILDHYEKRLEGIEQNLRMGQSELILAGEHFRGCLPSLILQLFLNMVPPIMEFLSSIQGYISHSQIEKSACDKVLWFTIWNVFFATVISGSILTQISIFLEPCLRSGPGIVFHCICFDIEWASTSSELFQMVQLIWSLITKP